MESDVIENYVKLERAKLEQEKVRLQSARSMTYNCDKVHHVAVAASPTATFNSNMVQPSQIESAQLMADDNANLLTKSSANLANVVNELPRKSVNEDKCPAAVLLMQREEALSAGSSPVKVREGSRVLNLSPCNKARNKVSAVKASADFSNSSNEDEESKSLSNSRPTSEISGKRNLRSPRYAEEETMGEWITDSFYSHFPSFNIIEQKRKNLAKERQRELQEYLQKASQNDSAPPKLATSTKYAKSSRPASGTENQPPDNNNDPNSDPNNDSDANPKSKLLENLKHTWKVTGESTVDEKVDKAEIERRKKAEYQKQLLQQIEEKRKEVEELRRRQKEEEELLAKNLEEQLRTMQLEDELEKAKQQAEKVRLNVEQSQARRLKLLENLKRDELLLKQSEQKIPHAAPDNKVYSYFSNSSHRSDYSYKKYSRESLFETSDSESENRSSCALSPVTPPSTCRYYNNGLPVISPHLSRIAGNLVVPRSEDQKMIVCRSCDRMFNPHAEPMSPHSPNRKKFCFDCVQNIRINRGNSRRASVNEEFGIDGRGSVPLNLDRPVESNTSRSFRVIDVSYGDSNAEPTTDRTLQQPIPNVSINHSSVNEKLSKYLKNYGDIISERSPTYFGAAKKNLEPKRNLSHIPLLREPPKKRVFKIREEIIPKKTSENVKKLSDKWEVPAVQKNIVSSSSGVLTQLGAFRKQLQIEKLELDKTRNMDK